MKTMYVVTTGCYSDYSIRGIYSTKKKAEAAKSIYMADNDIEEWTLNELPDMPKGLLPFEVVMDRDGAVFCCEQVDPLYVPSFEWEPYGDDVNVNFHMYAKDAKHAIKIANERRTALVASGEWMVNHEMWRNKCLTRD